MREILYKIFGRNDKTSYFSHFFREAPSYEKKRVIKKAIREANKAQKELVDKYEKLYSH